MGLAFKIGQCNPSSPGARGGEGVATLPLRARGKYGDQCEWAPAATRDGSGVAMATSSNPLPSPPPFTPSPHSSPSWSAAQTVDLNRVYPIALGVVPRVGPYQITLVIPPPETDENFNWVPDYTEETLIGFPQTRGENCLLQLKVSQWIRYKLF